jgi:integrase
MASVIYPRTWNHDFVQLPIVDKDSQPRPTVTKDELHTVLQSVNERNAVLFSLLAGTGLRIGECLAIRVSDFEPDCRALNVKRSIWQGKIQDPKTTNAIRVIDIAEPLAKVLREFVTGKSGYLFPNRKGNPLDQRNLLDALHSTYKGEGGFHMFRRFRAAVLRKAQVPEFLIKLWLGHARSLTDRYAEQLAEDVAYRQEWCENAGLGFDMGYKGYKNSTQIKLEKAA